MGTCSGSPPCGVCEFCLAEAEIIDEGMEEEDFWKARPVLDHIRTFARARLVAPWAVMGAVLARVVTATSAAVQLPPVIGGHASLNLFCALVGPSGDGKDAAQKVARDCLDLGCELMVAPLGSGEGISHMFMRFRKGVKGEPDELEQWNTASLVTIGEIDSLAAQRGRQASTVMPQLRQAAMGEQLGFFYVDQSKRMIVPEHRYRLCLIVGVQPRRAGVLLDDADGGTPQRFVWLPTTDATAPEVDPQEPPPMRWNPPAWHAALAEYHDGVDRYTMRLPRRVEAVVRQARRDRRSGVAEALDGHALLTREKVAAALAILDGRTEMVWDDWRLAGVVMDVSGRARGLCIREMAAQRRQRNLAVAADEADRAQVLRERADREAMGRAARRIVRVLADEGGELSHSALRREVGSRYREVFEDAMVKLENAGKVTVSSTAYRGVSGKIYALFKG